MGGREGQRPARLNGAIFSTDSARAYRVARRIRLGGLTINGNIIDPIMPFGGVTQSGYGREGGIEGLDNYLEPKMIHFA